MSRQWTQRDTGSISPHSAPTHRSSAGHLWSRRLATGLCWILVSVPCLTWPQRTLAQELVTDRPDQTESAETVPKGHVQLETGWTYRQDDSAGLELERQEVAGTLLRLGLTRRWELRVGWAGWSRQSLDSGPFREVLQGAEDGELGAKVRLYDESGARPAVALLFATSLPVGEETIGSERFDPSFRLSLSHTLSQRLSLGYNLGMAWGSTEVELGERHTLSRGEYTVALGMTFSDRLGSFVELYGDVAASDPGPSVHALDGGFTWLLSKTMQLDIAAGVGLSSSAEDWFLGLGFSMRLPD